MHFITCLRCAKAGVDHHKSNMKVLNFCLDFMIKYLRNRFVIGKFGCACVIRCFTFSGNSFPTNVLIQSDTMWGKHALLTSICLRH